MAMWWQNNTALQSDYILFYHALYTHQRHANSLKESQRYVSRAVFTIFITEASNKVLLRQCNETHEIIMVRKAHAHSYRWQEHENNRVVHDLQQEVPKVTSLLLCRHCWLIQMKFHKVSLQYRQVMPLSSKKPV